MNRSNGSGFLSFFGAAVETAFVTVSCPSLNVENDISFHRSRDCLIVNVVGTGGVGYIVVSTGVDSCVSRRDCLDCLATSNCCSNFSHSARNTRNLLIKIPLLLSISSSLDKCPSPTTTPFPRNPNPNLFT